MYKISLSLSNEKQKQICNQQNRQNKAEKDNTRYDAYKDKGSYT